MDETKLRSIAQLQEFLAATPEVIFTGTLGNDDTQRYEHISRVLKRFDYPQRNKGERGVVLAYLGRTSGYSRPQITRLVGRWHANRLAQVPLAKRYRAPAVPFARKYTASDVELLAQMDRANEDVCGPAVVHLLQRAYLVYGDERYERLAKLSVSHLYNLRKSAGYPVVFFDALRVKIRENGVVRNKAVYLALGVLADGTRDILGIWIESTEGAKFWMKVFNDMKTRGCNDVLIAVTDGLKGMGEALEVVYPQTTLQTCIVHLIRNSLDYANWKDRKPLAAAIKPIYTAPSAEAALAELDAFESGPCGKKFPTVVASWRRVSDKVIPFFAFPPEVRRVIYTTNAIESVNARLRKILKTRGNFPHDEAATKLIWLALRNITKDWARAAPHWKAAMNQFAILYQERFTQEVNLS